MNNNNRGILYLLVAVLAFVVSCGKESNAPEKQYVEVTFTADLSGDESGVKTSLSTASVGYGKVSWSASDANKVILFCAALENRSVISSGIAIDPSNSSVATITFQLTPGEAAVLEDNACYLYYGFSKVSYQDNAMAVNLNASQTYCASGGFSEGENPAVGYCQPGETYCMMRNLCGIIKLTVKLVDSKNNIVHKSIKSVRLTDNDLDSKLAGQFKVKGASGTNPYLEYVQDSGGSSRTIEITVPGDGVLRDSTDFYFIVPSGTLASDKGMNLLVYTSDGCYGGKKIKLLNGAQISRSTVLDVNSTKAIITVDDPVPTSYLAANSFVVPASAGLYTIPAEYKGNSYQGNGSDIAAKSRKIEGGSYAEILWQTRCDGDGLTSTEIISNPVYHKVKKNGVDFGVITFNRSGIDGNALVALKNASGTILWSWHLWVANDVSAINEGIDLMTPPDSASAVVGVIMDRNLGALTSDFSKGSISHGLQYQFGRKDPFMGSSWSVLDQNEGDNYSYYMTLYPEKAIELTSEDPFTIDGDSVQQPVCRNQITSSWTSEVPSWSKSGCSTNSPKSLYDPCPAGWRTIEEVNIAKAFGYSGGSICRPAGEMMSAVDPSTGKEFYGFRLTNRGKDVYFPTSGYSPSANVLRSIGTQSSIWAGRNTTYMPSLPSTQALYLKIEKQVGTPDAYGVEFLVTDMVASMPVRCVKCVEPSEPTK